MKACVSSPATQESEAGGVTERKQFRTNLNNKSLSLREKQTKKSSPSPPPQQKPLMTQGEMTKQVNVTVVKSENVSSNPQDSHGGKRNLAMKSFTCIPTHVHNKEMYFEK